MYGKKRIFVISLLLFSIFFFSSCERKQDDSDVSVTLLNTGKSDCILIRSSGKTMMIDTGYEENSSGILNFLKDNEIEYLDYLVLSHPDKDHIGGADKILRNIEVGTVYQTTAKANTKAYREYAQALEDENIKPVTVRETMELSIGKAKAYIYPPMKDEYEGTNDYSLAVKVIYRETDFLFAGDAEIERMEELLVQIPDIQSDFLKVPHHGIEKESGFFLGMVRPQIAVVTNENSWVVGEQVMQTIGEYGGKVYFTGDGEITVSSDGKELTLQQQTLQ